MPQRVVLDGRYQKTENFVAFLQSSGGTRLVLDGVCTLRTSDRTHAALLQITAQFETEIDCSGVEEVDLSFVQLLLAARAGALQAGRRLTLVHPLPGVILDALERGGFLGEQADDKGFWTHEEGS